jgi:hypothetical protein
LLKVVDNLCYNNTSKILKMKNSKNKYAAHYLFVILSTLLLLSGSAYAQSSSAGSKPAAAAATEQEKLANRISERKNLLKIQFSEAQTQNISKNCVAAQVRIKKILSNDKKAADKRQEAYANLSTRATTIIRTLQNQGVDITELKTAQIQFDTAINQYIADTSVYKSAVSDSLEANCASDPAGFEVTLATARQLRITLSNDANQVKSARTVLSQALAKSAEILNEKAVVRP